MDWSVEEGHPLGEVLSFLNDEINHTLEWRDRVEEGSFLSYLDGILTGYRGVRGFITGLAHEKVHGRREGFTRGEEG